MPYMPEIELEGGAFLWVEKTGDLKIRICLANDDPDRERSMTIAQADELIRQIEAKKAEIAAFKPL